MPKKVLYEQEQLPLSDVSRIADYPITESELYHNCFKQEVNKAACPTYSRKNGLLFTDNSLQWLKNVCDHSIDLVFADPPYNIKKADWDKFESQEEYIRWSLCWIQEVSRILKPSGSLYVCGFSEMSSWTLFPVRERRLLQRNSWDGNGLLVI